MVRKTSRAKNQLPNLNYKVLSRFRAWMCGSSLEIIPCSIIGHVFPKKGFYDRSTVIPNSVLVAEVWLDEFKDSLFYNRSPAAKLIREKSGFKNLTSILGVYIFLCNFIAFSVVKSCCFSKTKRLENQIKMQLICMVS